MSPVKKELPPYIRTSPLRPGKVSCEYCAAYSKTPWFLAKNLPQHLKCASHVKTAGVKRVQRETQERLNRLRAEETKRQSASWDALLSCPNQPKVLVPATPPPDADEQQMWDEFDLDQSGASLRDAIPVNHIEREEAEFYRALDRAMADPNLPGKDFEELDLRPDVDETLTKIMQSLG